MDTTNTTNAVEEVLNPVNPNCSGSMNDQNTFVRLKEPDTILRAHWRAILAVGVLSGIASIFFQRFRNRFTSR